MPKSDLVVLHNPDHLPASLRRPVLAIGNFDGIHRGHKLLLETAKAIADVEGGASGILTFEPHARAFLQPDIPFFRLTDPAGKATILAGLGLDLMVVMPFNAALMAMSAEAFIRDLLVERLAVGGVVIGPNFRFGHGREGDAAALVAAGERLGFVTRIVEPVNAGQMIISSTAVREALRAGDVTQAADLLGHWWHVTAPVAHGDKRGRELGYPTANMLLDAHCGLAYGIYAVRARVKGRVIDGVASFGSRPTFDNGLPRLESFLFDFAEDIYGEAMTVEFIARIRGEEKFASIDALIARMAEDVREAKRILAAPPKGALGPIRSMLGAPRST